jgi:uncharacterized protein YdeI (YjbR/CyaY-like superfamily)
MTTKAHAANSSIKKNVQIPSDLQQALAKNAAAQIAFLAFSPSHQREYVKWISEAKREETRAKRVQATLEKLTGGKA